MMALMYPHRMEPVADVLHAALEDPLAVIQIWASRTLTSFEDRTATAARLAARLQAEVPPQVQISLLWALARLGIPAVRDQLVPAAQSQDPEVVAAAVYGLGLAGDPSDIPLLRRLRDERPKPAPAR